MRVTIVGAGYVGLTLASVLANLGHQVSLVEKNEEKRQKIKVGRPPFFEPGLKALLKKVIKNKRLSCFSSLALVKLQPEVIFICVGTPSRKNGSIDLSFVFSAAREIGQNLRSGYTVVVLKSTSLPRTTRQIAKIIGKNKNKNADFNIAFCPEFLREGHAVEDTLHPNRVIIGSESKKTIKVLKQLNKKFVASVLVTKIESAELIKYAANSYLALRIVFANQLASLAKVAGADIKEVVTGIGLDPRIGSHYWYPGLGYGGSCFPKDVAALASFARNKGMKDSLFKKMDILNKKVVGKRLEELEKDWGSLGKKRIAVWGLACKQGTDDVRGSMAIKMIKELLKKGAQLAVFDYLAMENARGILPNIGYKNNPYEAVKRFDALLVLTDDPKFSKLSFERVKVLMRGNKIFDARNILNKDKLIKLGFNYQGTGH